MSNGNVRRPDIARRIAVGLVALAATSVLLALMTGVIQEGAADRAIERLRSEFEVCNGVNPVTGYCFEVADRMVITPRWEER